MADSPRRRPWEIYAPTCSLVRPHARRRARPGRRPARALRRPTQSLPPGNRRHRAPRVRRGGPLAVRQPAVDVQRRPGARPAEWHRRPHRGPRGRRRRRRPPAGRKPRPRGLRAAARRKGEGPLSCPARARPLRLAGGSRRGGLPHRRGLDGDRRDPPARRRRRRHRRADRGGGEPARRLASRDPLAGRRLRRGLCARFAARCQHACV